MTEELTTTQPAGLPALAYNPNQELTAEDIPTPRLKFAQGLSAVVTDELVPYGAIYSVIGRDDQSPEIVAKPAAAKGQIGPAVRFYVLDIKKGYSYADTNGDLDNTRDGSYPDLSVVKNNDPREVYRTFDYTIVVPSLDTFLPRKLMLYKKWGGSAAKRINLALLQAQQQNKEFSSVAFSLRAKKDSKDTHSFATAIVDVADVPAVEAAKDAEVVAKLRAFVGGPQSSQPAPTSTPVEAPAID